MKSKQDNLMAKLPDTFRFSEALEYGSERALRSLIADGQVERLARGLYRKAEITGDEDLTEISARATSATLCLRTALARHDLIDDIPTFIDVAIPRGTWTPATRAPVRWHHFDKATFQLGRTTLDAEHGRIGIYSAERSIVDAFRLYHLEGIDLAHDALKSWIRQGGQPSMLLQIATSFPRSVNSIRSALELLL